MLRNVEDMNAAVVKGETVTDVSARGWNIFLGLLKSNIHWKIIFSRVNGSAGNGLEIPCEFSIEGDRRAVNRLEKKISNEKILVKSFTME